MRRLSSLLLFLGISSSITPALAVENLLMNPAFLDTNMDMNLGDGWGAFDVAEFNNFFGASHASLFGNDAFFSGGVFQSGIQGAPGTTYQFDIMDSRIEANWDADLVFGFEYYAADDTTLLGESVVPVDYATRLALPNVGGDGAANGAAFSMQATPITGTQFIRPVIKFDNVNPTYLFGVTTQASTFVFNAFASEVPGLGDEILKNPGFEDLDGNGNTGDHWRSFGAAEFNDFFGGNGHASLFSDQPGNFGGVYQSAILGSDGTTYEFSLTDVRIEDNVDADFRFGLEYYADDDFTKLGETIVPIDTSTTGDGLSFSMTSTAVAGTVYIRPIVLFDNVQSTANGQENVFLFEASLTEINGTDPDFDDNGLVDGFDVDALVMEIVAGTNLGQFDLTGDMVVDGADLTEWLAQAGAINLASGNPYLVGDANLDGIVDGLDFVDWNDNKFTAIAAWTAGDFNADGVVDGLDFIEWNGNKFMSADYRAVPEPNSLFVVMLGLVGLLATTRELV